MTVGGSRSNHPCDPRQSLSHQAGNLSSAAFSERMWCLICQHGLLPACHGSCLQTPLVLARTAAMKLLPAVLLLLAVSGCAAGRTLHQAPSDKQGSVKQGEDKIMTWTQLPIGPKLNSQFHSG